LTLGIHFGNRIFFEETSHESRIERRSDLDDLLVSEPADPTVAVVKPEAILSGGKRMQFNYGPIAAHKGVLYLQLRTLRQDVIEFLESVSAKIRFAVVVTGKRMSPLDSPVNIIRNMGEKVSPVTAFKMFENIANPRQIHGHSKLLCSLEFFVKRRVNINPEFS
jgi:hypothetical protein